MTWEIIVPNEWKALPFMTLQEELVRIISQWQATYKSTHGIVATINNITAKLVEIDYNWWFRRINDRACIPNRYLYSKAVIYCGESEEVRSCPENALEELDLKERLSSAPIEIKRRDVDKFV